MRIHSTAIVAPTAELGKNVQIGPFCVIEDHAVVGADCELATAVTIKRGVRLGSANRVDVGAVIGANPQHLAAGQQVGDLVVGCGNQIREYATVHRAFQPGSSTQIGDDNLLMVASHIGHDCSVGNANVIANNVMLAGHVEMGSRNYIGGGAAFHQFCRIGDLTMVGGLAQVKRDVPPYVLVDGGSGLMVGLNTVGLRRAGVSADDRRQIKAAYRLAFRSDLAWDEKMHALQREFPLEPIRSFWEFLAGGKRGILTDRRTTSRSTESLHQSSNKTNQLLSLRKVG